jgi:hypothetical protein
MEEKKKYRTALDDEKIKLFMDRVVKEHLLPNAKYGSASALGSAGVEKFNYANIDLSDSFKVYRKSKYYYEGNYRFIHYTSIQKLLSIVRDKKLRMYDLRGMDDKDEFGFAFKSVLRDSEHIIETIKPKVFCLSMCEYEVEEKKKSLNLWRQFGADGYGAGIVIEFNKKDRREGFRYMLSKVHYGERYLDKLKTTKAAYEAFKKEYTFKVQNVDEFFYKLFCFHKQDIYREEQEVRFLYNEGFSYYDKESELLDMSGKLKLTSYHELAVEDDRWEIDKGDDRKLHERMKRIFPYVTIKAIVLGYRLSDNQKRQIVDALQPYLGKYKQKPEIIRSRLQEHF